MIPRYRMPGAINRFPAQTLSEYKIRMSAACTPVKLNRPPIRSGVQEDRSALQISTALVSFFMILNCL